MKKAILLVSFGTAYQEARDNSLECIARDLEMAGGIPLYQAYTSRMVVEKLSRKGIQVNTVGQAVKQVLSDGVSCLFVIPSHMIPGIEYQKMVRELENYRESFDAIKIASSVLQEREDCIRIALLLSEMFSFCLDYEYILMGHGSEDASNIRYQQMNEAFLEKGLFNVQIASVEAKPDLEDAIRNLQKRSSDKKVLLYPFMVVAGDHARNDMAGEEDSYLAKLRDAGFQAEAVVKGLGEYSQFRKIYIDKLLELL